MNTTKTPIALFTYNRPRHTQTVLESLSRCARLDECSLHIYCDGPKHPEQLNDVEPSRQVVRQWARRLGGKVIERETNLGLARSIVSGVTELCEKYGRVIVLEDDLVLNALFLDFMIQALDHYEHEPKVYQISGYMFPVEHPAKPDAFFLPMTTTWGWATWNRAWRVFDWDASDAREALRDPGVRQRFDLDNSHTCSAMLEDRLKGLNDSWGILFWWAVFKTGGLVLHPRRSLVSNVGFDGSGTHCGDRAWSNQPLSEVTSEEHHHKLFALPEKVTCDDAAFRKIKRFLRQQERPTLTSRVWLKLERMKQLLGNSPRGVN